MAQHQQHSSSETPNSLKAKVDYKREMSQHHVSFIMMILLTLIAFVAVASDAIADSFTVLFIIILAVIQVVFQLFIFMHLGQKDHDYPTWGIYMGIFVAVLTVAALMGLIW
jgi:cytochrome c oxidase subunit IV